MMLYELFDSEAKMLGMSSKIDTLFNYPKAGESIKGQTRANVMTQQYRYIIKHKDQDRWASPIGEKLVDECLHMTKQQRDEYYENTNLKNIQYLIDNGWIELINI